MYLSGSQVGRERTDRHVPSTKDGPSMSRKRKKKGAPTVNRKEERRLSDEKKNVPLNVTKKRVHPYGKREDLRCRCLSPPQIKLQGHLHRQLTVPQGTTNSLEELDLRMRKWWTQAMRKVNNRAKLRSHRINEAEFNHREWWVRDSVGWGGD
jgi:hypothetical protein